MRQFIGLRSVLKSDNKRTKLAQKNVISSLLLKVISIIVSFEIVPITIGYISSEQYGIWITISSIVAWLSYFDIGFGGGLRYRFAESKAKQNYTLAKSYVSTTYALIALSFSLLGAFALIANHYLDWCVILNLSASLKITLRTTFALFIICFCSNFVFQTIFTVLEADQMSAKADLIKTLGNIFTLIVIIILSYTTEGNLKYLVFAFSFVPSLVTFIASIYFFHTKELKIFSPSLRSIDFSLTKNILGMGIKYFAITSVMFIIFQFINIIITRELGPENATVYNVAYRYYNLLLMTSLIILTPFWSASTEAFIQKDFKWLSDTLRKLEKLELLLIIVGFIMFSFSNVFFSLWLGGKVYVPVIISFFVFVQNACQLLPQCYMYIINGTGKLKIQLIVYSLFAILAVPSLIYLCKWFGIPGISSFIIVLFVSMTFFCRKQVKLLTSGKAKGIWNK